MGVHCAKLTMIRKNVTLEREQISVYLSIKSVCRYGSTTNINEWCAQGADYLMTQTRRYTQNMPAVRSFGRFLQTEAQTSSVGSCGKVPTDEIESTGGHYGVYTLYLRINRCKNLEHSGGATTNHRRYKNTTTYLSHKGPSESSHGCGPCYILFL